ncbi:antibiotic biosynthesis monooxygenase family protein [Sphaerisporangium perillae]|uniref:antibiotic biosynthesis monooxygenase family protein n=1 Tax=Sphaerisporangium perillae TaxID=2935860 RepID=UPI00200D638A|nr:antibiotic biosynthesis monooxygenase [Sphaerisporangium perillae]
MIARIWRATATIQGAEAYRRHFAESVLPVLQSLDGHRGAYLLRRDRSGGAEIEVMTLWESLDAVQDFAGPDFESAVIEPEARAVLAEFDTSVTHHDVVIETVSDLP